MEVGDEADVDVWKSSILQVVKLKVLKLNVVKLEVSKLNVLKLNIDATKLKGRCDSLANPWLNKFEPS